MILPVWPLSFDKHVFLRSGERIGQLKALNNDCKQPVLSKTVYKNISLFVCLLLRSQMLIGFYLARACVVMY